MNKRKMENFFGTFNEEEEKLEVEKMEDNISKKSKTEMSMYNVYSKLPWFDILLSFNF